jgi:hypothetical protein
VQEGTISVAELRHRYIVHGHALAGSYTEAARRLQIDWRTVRSAVKAEKAALRASASASPRSRGAPPAVPPAGRPQRASSAPPSRE